MWPLLRPRFTQPPRPMPVEQDDALEAAPPQHRRGPLRPGAVAAIDHHWVGSLRRNLVHVRRNLPEWTAPCARHVTAFEFPSGSHVDDRRRGASLNQRDQCLGIHELHLVPWKHDASHNSRAEHPASLRCDSLTYVQYSRSSRLAIRAPRSGNYATHHASRGRATSERINDRDGAERR